MLSLSLKRFYPINTLKSGTMKNLHTQQTSKRKQIKNRWEIMRLFSLLFIMLTVVFTADVSPIKQSADETPATIVTVCNFGLTQISTRFDKRIPVWRCSPADLSHISIYGKCIIHEQVAQTLSFTEACKFQRWSKGTYM
jgi:hypothetical protein